MPSKYFFGTRHFFLAEEWVKKGHEVSIFTSNQNHLTDKLPKFKSRSFQETINGVKTHWLRTFISQSSGSLSRILSWIHFEYLVLKSGNRDANAKKPDIIIVSSLSLLSILSGYYFSKKFHAQFILEIRDIWPLTAMELGGYSKWNPFILFLSWIEKLGYRNADVIVGTMPNLIEHVQNTVDKFQRCVCIPQGITNQQLNTFEKLPDEYIKKVFQRKAFRIAYTGTMNKANPIETLLEVAKNMGPDAGIDFYFLGKGDEKPKYMQEYGSFDHIHFLDAIPKNQVRDFLNNVDVTYDSFYGGMAKYGLSRNKWIDYMAASKPIICSFSGYQSLINDAKCGVFVPENDQKALLQAIKEFKNLPSNELKEMGDNGRRYIEDYRTFDKLSSEYELLFK